MSITLPSELTTILSYIGMRWPEGDEDRLSQAAQLWGDFATAMAAPVQKAQAGAQQVWQRNDAQLATAFATWWAAPHGPRVNLSNTITAAGMMSANLTAHAMVVTTLKAAYIAQLGVLAAELAAATATVVVTGPGALALDALLIELTRRSMRRLVAAAAAAVAAQQISKFQPVEELLPPAIVRPPVPATDRDPQPGPDPRDRPGPVPVPVPLPTRRRTPGCERPTNQGTVFVGDVDRRVAGTGIWRVEGWRAEGGARVSRITGELDDPMDRQHFEQPIRGVSPSLNVTGYHGGHLWGPGLGSEAGEGILLVAGNTNVSEQAMIENWLRTLHTQAKAVDGYVVLEATGTSFPATAFPGAANFLEQNQYRATVCYPDGTEVPYPPIGLEFQRGTDGWPGRGRPWGGW